jgi:oligopeptide/dipeptide ABC transporter ATP-binding protein
METSSPLLHVRGLTVKVNTGEGLGTAVGPIELTLERDSVVAVVGESGSGKSLMALALGWLAPPGAVLEGSVRFDGLELSDLSERRLATIRGRRMGFSLQEAATALNPVYSVGFQLREVFRLHLGWSHRQAETRAAQLLEDLGFSNPRMTMRSFPHQLSGGQQQRVVLALALGPEPDLLVADEPTAALDPILRAGIMAQIDQWRRRKKASLVLVSHDLREARRLAHSVLVLYAGEVVETGPADQIFERPLHPYTRFLTGRQEALARPELPPPAPGTWGKGCRLVERCALAEARCSEVHPPLETSGDRRLRCPVVRRETAP